ncbi:MAG: carbohydrate kinase [Pseudomonadota bacterium]
MILCCGEALIDMLPAVDVQGQACFAPVSGGAIFNTAIALGRLGAHTGMLTGLSTDMFGQQLETDLKSSRVDTSLVIKSDRPTTLAFVRLVDGHATYTFYDENSAGRMIAAEDLPSLPGDIVALYFGGISLVSEPGAQAYAALAEAAGQDRAVFVDPNIRPSFIRDVPAYRERMRRVLGCADIAKVSDEDLNWIYPGGEPMTEKVARISGSGPAMVIVTRGGQGATAYLRGGVQVDVMSQKVTVVDTVGAGDTFNAGVLAKLSELGFLSKGSIPEISPEVAEAALAHGAQVAAITVSRAGANPPWQDELAGT